MAVLTRASKNGQAGDAAAPRIAYSIDLIAERLSGRTEDHYVSPEMAWGSEYEALARAEYEMETGSMAESVGFILHPTMDFAGASPDSLIGNDGGIEIKCPKTTTHLKWMMAGSVPEEHQEQMLWNMACAEATWWDFVSYDPRMPDGLKLFVVRMNRDSERIAEMEAQVIKFNDAVEAMLTELRKRVKERPAPPVDTRSDFDQLMAMIDAQEMTP
jgi:predicted phage-related endonuclease